MAEFESFQNYQSNLENNMELREKLLKFEDLLLKKHEENNMLIKMHEDFKVLHERTRKECLELNQKLVQSYEKRTLSDKKYEAEIQRIKLNFEKQKEIYENQILKMTSNDTEAVKNKVTAEVELKNKHLIQQRDLEIDSLNEHNFELRKKFELLNIEYETFKNDSIREIGIIKENHKTEVKELIYKIQLLNDKCENNVDRESNNNIRLELEGYRRNINELQAEVSNLRKDKEILLSEKNEIKINLLKELDGEKLKFRICSNENEKFIQTLKNNETEINNIKNKFEEKNEEIKYLINEKFTLTKDLRFQETEYENFKNEIRLLRQKVSERDKEYEEDLKIEHEKEKQRFFMDKSEKEEFQRKIEELSNNHRNVQHDFKNFYDNSNEELHVTKRDFYIVQEEKRNLIRRVTELQQEIEVFQDDYDKKTKNLNYYEKEYARLEAQYRDLSTKEGENYKIRLNYDSEMNKKNEEISILLNLLKLNDAEQTNTNDKIKSEFKNKLEEISIKKKHYKKQV